MTASPGSALRTAFCLAAALSLMVLLALAAAELLYPRVNPHALFQSGDRCLSCHVKSGAKPDPDRFSPDCDAFCRSCHAADKLGRSHPVGVRPTDKYWKMKVPQDFRLDDDGRMMCLTCHTAHGPYLASVKAFPAQKPFETRVAGGGSSYKTIFLRRSDPGKGFSVLCDGCHKKL